MNRKYTWHYNFVQWNKNIEEVRQIPADIRNFAFYYNILIFYKIFINDQTNI